MDANSIATAATIEIRHIETGLTKVFHSIEDLGRYLGERLHTEWEGWHMAKAHPDFLKGFAAAAHTIAQDVTGGREGEAAQATTAGRASPEAATGGTGQG